MNQEGIKSENVVWKLLFHNKVCTPYCVDDRNKNKETVTAEKRTEDVVPLYPVFQHNHTVQTDQEHDMVADDELIKHVAVKSSA